MPTRKLKTKYSVAPATDFFPDLGVEYRYTIAARWYQFWRWHLVLDRDYILSRAADIILTDQMAETIFMEMAAEEKP